MRKFVNIIQYLLHTIKSLKRKNHSIGIEEDEDDNIDIDYDDIDIDDDIIDTFNIKRLNNSVEILPEELKNNIKHNIKNETTKNISNIPKPTDSPSNLDKMKEINASETIQSKLSSLTNRSWISFNQIVPELFLETENQSINTKNRPFLPSISSFDLFTPFRVQNAQSWPTFSVKNAHKVGVFNEKWCKKITSKLQIIPEENSSREHSDANHRGEMKDNSYQNYHFFCTNTTQNLQEYIKPENPCVSYDIKQNKITYSSHIPAQQNIMQSWPEKHHEEEWKPPETHGLENCSKIIPDYYFQTHRSLYGEKILDIDYLFMIKDDIRNMRKLNSYQIEYIKTLEENQKNEIIHEISYVLNALIDTLFLFIEETCNDTEQISEGNTKMKRRQLRRTGSV